MALVTARPSVDALRLALDCARIDPRVVEISRWLRLDLTMEPLWLQVRSQAEANHQALAMGESKPVPLSGLDAGPKILRQEYVDDALAAYATISRI